MESKERIKEIVEFSLENGDKKTIEKYKIKESTLERYKRAINNDKVNTGKVINEIEEIDESGQTVKSISVRSLDIKTVEDLIKFSKIDLNKWKIIKQEITSWEVTMSGEKTHSGFPESYTNYRVSAKFAPIEIVTDKKIDYKKQVDNFINEIKNYSPEHYKSIKIVVPKDGECLLEVSVHDLHFAQLSWAKETGQVNYDVDIAKQMYLDCFDYMLDKARAFKVSRIMIPIGSDFYNVNNSAYTTAGGTLQDEDCRWQKSFSLGWRMARDAIDKCLQVAPIDIKIIPGNHDYERTYYLGEVLKAWYRNCAHVDIDNSPETRKFYTWEKNLIGLTHGKEEKIDSLPIIMATSVPELFARTLYHEFQIGHMHFQKETEFTPTKDIRGVLIRWMPSLAPLDSWTAKKGFGWLREAKGSVWHKEKGRIADINYHP